ncbi:hypothetical protein POX_c04557 [Penicillium oxalicum]|uniref:hypothetical protein n=1 Tax=Penicillium oxalicum TaxID=69781 RepID=UPI0020B7C91B|nr:hypothetical protein POX_c04557 [Penicillium oxalicum]KAI2791688.1 hypothetical protein POX_c04557 [Penicillium oxalicum]
MYDMAFEETSTLITSAEENQATSKEKIHGSNATSDVQPPLVGQDHRVPSFTAISTDRLSDSTDLAHLDQTFSQLQGYKYALPRTFVARNKHQENGFQHARSCDGDIVFFSSKKDLNLFEKWALAA